MSEVKRGDRVRITYEGEVAYVSHYKPDYFELADGSGHNSPGRGTVEIIQKPLAVGDEVTEENKAALPEGKYILADKDGDPWDSFPGCSGRDWTPFTLVYIHES